MKSLRHAAAQTARDRLISVVEGFTPAAERPQPPDPLRAHWRFDARTTRALAVVIAVVTLAVGWNWWNGRALPEQIAPVSIDASAAPAPSVTAASGSSSGDVVVDVGGDVRHPGLVTLPVGSRVADAIEEAGGATGSTAGVNLARVLVDGEQIVVGRAAASSGQPGKVPVNTADAGALDALPGIGPVLAQRIVDWRTANGPFSSVDALGDVPGIGPSLLAKLKPLVTT